MINSEFKGLSGISKIRSLADKVTKEYNGILKKVEANMIKDEYETIVVFRKWKNGGILALFPKEIADSYGNCMSYERVGQHSAAAYSGCVYKTKPAKPSEYAALKRELEGIGYNLDVKLRYSQK